ncbi:MAG: hypothetical protein U1E14_04920 [Geminicoccaceae bacterium]
MRAATEPMAARGAGAPRPAADQVPPPYRRLRVFTFDPAMSTKLDTAVINEAALRVPWEAALAPGPVGEYLEVIDRDPASDAVYLPVDLNDPALLAQDGLAPSEGNPQFHQQMVYAVAMVTIRNFERALGRSVVWRPVFDQDRGDKPREVPKLRVYPHALREANAYYSPAKRALLFGYFRALGEDVGDNLPGGMIFTCLSHDIIAHETTHAILDACKGRFLEPSNPDVLAFHEAFADIVALFQKFTFPEAVRHQIAQTRGDLGRQNLLGQLARQFGEAIGNRGALRDAITVEGETGFRKLGDVGDEPHDRGSVLVAAVFDAFLAIYRSRIADLLRLATGSGSTFPGNDLHPDLLNRMVGEANKAAEQVLRICIRALDYCPPVDITFGEYLRALITADVDHVPADERGYRLALIDTFRRRAIFPSECRSLSVESLLWRRPYALARLDGLRTEQLHVNPALGRAASVQHSALNQWMVWQWLNGPDGPTPEVAAELGLAMGDDAPVTIRRSRETRRPAVEVHSVRVARRAGHEGQSFADLVMEITQRRRGYLDPSVQRRVESQRIPWHQQPPEDFWFRGGCTLILDLRTGLVRYAVAKGVCAEERLERQRAYLLASRGAGSLRAAYFGGGPERGAGEPLALLHRHG